MSEYNDDSLRQLLERWREKGGHLVSDQIQALIEWEQTPDDARRELAAELEQRGPRSLFQRLSAVVRRIFSS